MFQAEVRDELHHVLISNQASADNTEYWIGLNDIENEGTYTWYHSGQGSERFTAWGQGEPTELEGEDCVAMSQEHFLFWADRPCNETRDVVCFAPEYLNPCRSPFTYVPEADTCYYYGELAGNYITYQEALGICTGMADDVYLVS